MSFHTWEVLGGEAFKGYEVVVAVSAVGSQGRDGRSCRGCKSVGWGCVDCYSMAWINYEAKRLLAEAVVKMAGSACVGAGASEEEGGGRVVEGEDLMGEDSDGSEDSSTESEEDG